MRPLQLAGIPPEVQADHYIYAMETEDLQAKKENIDQAFDRYNTHLDIKFAHLERIDIPEMVAACPHKWYNQTLTQVNDSVVRLGIVEGEYHWHKHDNDDEFFFVLQGQLLIDLEDRTIELNPGQGVTISKGIMHRPRAPLKTVMLMFETSAIRPTGD
jgi:mannose-6-phosphate isomerase-like protein (cupin superfamily)